MKMLSSQPCETGLTMKTSYVNVTFSIKGQKLKLNYVSFFSLIFGQSMEQEYMFTFQIYETDLTNSTSHIRSHYFVNFPSLSRTTNRE